MCAKKVRSGGISMGSQNFRAVAARATIVIRGRGVNPSHPTGCSWRVTYPCAIILPLNQQPIATHKKSCSALLRKGSLGPIDSSDNDYDDKNYGELF